MTHYQISPSKFTSKVDFPGVEQAEYVRIVFQLYHAGSVATLTEAVPLAKILLSSLALLVIL